MNRQDVIDNLDFLYHLTDVRNIPTIKNRRALLSTVEIVRLANLQDADAFLRTKRPTHSIVNLDDSVVYIRDQRPINIALDKCLTDGWSREDFIYHLNNRVFWWPNMGRLSVHFGRYEAEKPVILRIKPSDLFEINNTIEITHLNSGATRPHGRYGGKAPSRGPDTFKQIEDFPYPISKIAEVTFPLGCLLPNNVEISTSPNGPWSNLF